MVEVTTRELELLIGVLVFVTLMLFAYLMWSTDKDSHEHVYDSLDPVNEWEAKVYYKGGKITVVRQRHYTRCMVEGCYQSKEEWKEVGSITTDDSEEAKDFVVKKIEENHVEF